MLSRIYLTSVHSLCCHRAIGCYWVAPGCFYLIPFNGGFRRILLSLYRPPAPSRRPTAAVTMKSAMSVWPKTPFLCSPWTLHTGWCAWSGIRSDCLICSDLGEQRLWHHVEVSPPGPTSTAGWWMWRYSVVLVSHVTPFLLLIAWQPWFSEAPEPVGTWGGRFSQWRDFLLEFSSATTIDCGAHELHPLFYVQLGFGVQKAFHVLILCLYLINFKNTLFFVFLSISASHGQLLIATVGNKCKKLLNDMLNLKA